MRWKLLLDDLGELPSLIKMGTALRRATRGHGETLGPLLRRQAERFPDRVFLRFESETLTYDQFNRSVNAFASVLTRAGVGREPIALMMENSPTLLAAQAAAAKIGAIAALINTHLSGAALAHVLHASQARHVFADAACLPAIVGSMRSSAAAASSLAPSPANPTRTVWGQGPTTNLPVGVEALDEALASASIDEPDAPDVHGSDVFLYIYTSGTTGYPKPAIIRHSRFTMAGIGLGGMFGIGPDDVIYAPLPLYHGESNFVGFSVALRAGGAFASRRQFSASEFLHDVRRHGVTMFVYVGELCRYVLRQPPTPHDRDHKLRLAAGAGLRPDIWREFQTRFGITRIVEMYGMTEGNVSLMNLNGPVGSVGRAHPFQHHKVKLARYDFDRGELVCGPDGSLVECAVGEPGELVGVIDRGGYMPYDGYTDRKATESRIVHNAFRKGDAYFRTGDVLRKDADGYYYFVDRLGDTFRWKGENVATLEVGEVLNRALGVSETNVYGIAIPGAEGRCGAVAVVLKQGASFDPRSFYAHAERELPAYARPGFVRLVESMDATGTLKHRKVELQRQGFDLALISDPLFVRDDSERTYVAMTSEITDRVQAGSWRL